MRPFKRIMFIVYILFLVSMLSAGVLYADYNTRRIGFEDAMPVVSYSITENYANLHIMDNDLTVEYDEDGVVSSILNGDNETAPQRFGVVKALVSFIKMIIDWFAQVCGQ